MYINYLLTIHKDPGGMELSVQINVIQISWKWFALYLRPCKATRTDLVMCM